MNATDWNLQRLSGPASQLFGGTAAALNAVNDAGLAVDRILRVLTVSESTVVLGSSQPLEDIVKPSLGTPIVRRRSGGGAVWLEPAAMVWFDLMVGRSDQLWSDDVGRATWWVGEAFARALRNSGCRDAVAHRGAMVHNALDRKVCWTGLGPGEVTGGAGGPKLVGIAQKRKRRAVVFQVGVLITPCQYLLAEPMGLDPAAILVSERGIATDRETLIESVLDALPKI